MKPRFAEGLGWNPVEQSPLRQGGRSFSLGLAILVTLTRISGPHRKHKMGQEVEKA